MNRALKRRDLETDGRGLLRGVLAALLVLTVLVPSDSIEVREGAGILLVLLWLLLALAWCLNRRRDHKPVRWGLVETAVTLLVLAHTVSCLWRASEGNARATYNTMWQWMSFGMSFLLMRQLVDSPRIGRALMVVMLAVAASLSLEGLYESLYEVPQRYRRYFDNDETVRQQMLQEAGLVAPRGTPLRYHFESRLQSTEPTTSFSLTNSLAGFLAPWLIIAIGMTVLCYRSGERGLTLPGSRRDRLLSIAPELLLCALLGFCLLLTKSRSGWVGVGVGMLVLLAGQGRGGRDRFGNWILASFLLLTLGLGALAFMLKRLDWLVFTQTFESFSFRLQYWVASLGMIADYPLLGCGPGNFQDYYMQYKLPIANETVADPHNWILEIWTTAGTLAMLAVGLVLYAVSREVKQLPGELAKVSVEAENPLERSIYLGAVIGALLAFPYGLVSRYSMNSTFNLALGLPLMLLVIARLNRWVKHGSFPAWLPLAALLGWLVNLLAASGIGIPGVAQGGWLLLAMLLVHGTAKSQQTLPAGRLTVVTLLLLALTASFLVVGYWPVMSSRNLVLQAQSGNNYLPHRVPVLLEEAREADPHWPRPAMDLALLCHGAWGPKQQEPRTVGEEGLRSEFVQAADIVLARDPRSAITISYLATCYLVAYQQYGHTHDVVRARELFERAHDLHPSDARLAGQAAWACWLCGDRSAAGELAKEAWRLNKLNKSIELQLDKRLLIEQPFPQWEVKKPSSGGVEFNDMNKLVTFLRNQSSWDDRGQ